jgi:predicted O-methyltransferase YrrM
METNPLWHEVDAYFDDRLVPPDDALAEALRTSEAAGLPAIAVTPTLGKLLRMLAEAIGAKRILEVGTLGGYSTIWLARALPAGGRLVTLELSAEHAAVARANLKHAGLDDRVEVVVGAAAGTLERMSTQGGVFDFVFIDADKANNDVYFREAHRLSRVGTLIVVDNVVRDGRVIDSATTDANILGVRRLVDHLAGEKRVSATAVQTVGAKGYDGFIVARVLEPAT